MEGKKRKKLLEYRDSKTIGEKGSTKKKKRKELNENANP